MSGREIFAAGQQRFPSVRVDQAAFVAHLQRLPSHGTDPDLYLAFACAMGDPIAHQVLETDILSQVPQFIARIDGSAQVVDEVRQLLRERLLVKRGEQLPRIAEYAGLGPLGAWVRVAALRVALNRLGSPAHHVELDAAPALATPSNPELVILRGRYLEAYQVALRDAVGLLTTAERSLMRLSIVDGVSIDRLATMYSIHRATAARRVNSAKQRLLEETYRLLGERLQLAESDLRSLAPLLQSQLHLSLARLL